MDRMDVMRTRYFTDVPKWSFPWCNCQNTWAMCVPKHLFDQRCVLDFDFGMVTNHQSLDMDLSWLNSGEREYEEFMLDWIMCYIKYRYGNGLQLGCRGEGLKITINLHTFSLDDIQRQVHICECVWPNKCFEAKFNKFCKDNHPKVFTHENDCGHRCWQIYVSVIRVQ